MTNDPLTTNQIRIVHFALSLHYSKEQGRQQLFSHPALLLRAALQPQQEQWGHPDEDPHPPLRRRDLRLGMHPVLQRGVHGEGQCYNSSG